MGRRTPVWLPYLEEINVSSGGVLDFKYKGGEGKASLKNISCIMIYGETEFPVMLKTFEKITRAGIPIIYTRRNIATPMVIHGGLRHDIEDTITKQIKVRENKTKKKHIARTLLKNKMKSMEYILPSFELPENADIDKLRNIEASHAKKYWEIYFEKLGHSEWTRRGDETGKNPVSKVLDAASRFISGIALRWILFHHLSPSHGFLHTPTDYQSLVYDLMEPYRGIFELELLKLFVENEHLLYNDSEDKLLGSAINRIKEKYNERCYCPLTRQIVTYHELIHGCVLSLKYYCLGKHKVKDKIVHQRKFLIPMPGKPNGGRPPKVDFLLYGRHAGKTDFWKVAREVSNNETD